MELTPEEVAGFPVLSITLEDFVVLDITPDRYLERAAMGNSPTALYAPRCVCLRPVWVGQPLGRSLTRP